MADESKNQPFAPNLFWEVPEFIHYPKTSLWYTAVIVVGVIVLLLGAFVLKNLVFVLIIILGTIMVIVHGAKHPEIIKISLDARGVDLEHHKFVSFDKIDGFSVYHMHPDLTKEYIQLVLHHKGRFHPYIKILAPVGQTDAIKKFLIQHLPAQLLFLLLQARLEILYVPLFH